MALGLRGERGRSARPGRFVARVALALLVAVAAAPPAQAHDDPDRRVAELTRLLAQDPASAALHLERAELHRFRGDQARALADLHEAKRLDPAMPAIDFALARLMLDAGNLSAARDAVDRFLVVEPDHVGAYLLRSQILARSGDGAGAAQDISRAIERSGARRGSGRGVQPDDYLLRARLLAEAGRADEAVRGLDEGMAALGSPVTLALGAVEIDVARGHHDAALVRLAALEARARRKETWQARRADVLDAAGRHHEAEAARRAALASIATLGPAQRASATTAALEQDLRRRLEGRDQSPTPGELHAP